MSFIKKNITLVLGLSIPVVMILFIAASIYLPAMFIKPSYSFVYILGDYYSQYEYEVLDGKLVRSVAKQYEFPNPEFPRSVPPSPEPRLYLYDLPKDETREISFEEAQKLSLDPSIKSPDGFEVVHGNHGGGFFPFFYSGSDYGSIYLKGRGVSKRIDTTSNEKYLYNFRFLGWVENQIK